MKTLNETFFHIKDRITLIGRVWFEDGNLALPWSASGAALRFSGNAISVTLMPYKNDDSDLFNVAMKLEVDGVAHKALVVEGGALTLFADGLGEGEHIARIYKIGESNEPIFLRDLSVLGEAPEVLEWHERHELRLEVVGDSITCGYGALGAGDTFVHHEEDATAAYGFLTGEALDAETRIISWSGRGIVRAWDGRIAEKFCEFFTQRARLKKYGMHDFGEWQPDILVINGGTNDGGSGKLQAGEFVEGVRELYALAREKYPRAEIIFFYGAMGVPLAEDFALVMDELLRRDAHLYYLPTEPIEGKPDEIGANGHPSALAQRRFAAELTDFIKKVVLPVRKQIG